MQEGNTITSIDLFPFFNSIPTIYMKFLLKKPCWTLLHELAYCDKQSAKVTNALLVSSAKRMSNLSPFVVILKPTGMFYCPHVRSFPMQYTCQQPGMVKTQTKSALACRCWRMCFTGFFCILFTDSTIERHSVSIYFLILGSKKIKK